MPDLALSVLLSRTQLGLAALQINDHETYYVAPSFFGGQVTWTRTQVGSPFLDGQVTTNRTRAVINEPVTVEVLGETPAGLQQAQNDLISAFIQDSFTVTIAIGSARWEYLCEAADYQVAWTGPRFLATQGQVVLSVPRQPVPVVGVA